MLICRYIPLFDYFKDFSDTAFRVVADDYVTSDSGSGIVHCAPAFGEDDYRVCIENQIINKVCEFVKTWWWPMWCMVLFCIFQNCFNVVK